ncbi:MULTISPECIES: hypothetical protein [Arthrobacter]|uniref:hypothetical protein n=1 Tax=Arthrobacter TaxID=1663 RepID=UPI000A878C90|nr:MULTISPECIES: hypothetical protein [Arthrobacter]
MSIDELVVVADHFIRIPRPEFEGRTEPYATLEELAVMLGCRNLSSTSRYRLV